MPTLDFVLLVAGGIAYTIGAVVYGAIHGDSDTVRLSIGVIGAGAFMFGLGMLGLRASLSTE